jgi:serine/threonine-protein kinase
MKDVKNHFYRLDNIEIDVQNLRVTVDSEIRPLEPKSFRLLLFLVQNSGRVLPKDEIMAAVWPDAFVSDNSLNRAVTQIRKALDDDPRAPRYIETIPTVGYRLVADFNEEQGSHAVDDAAGGDSTHVVGSTPVDHYRWAALAGTAAVLIGLTLGGWFFWRATRPLSQALVRLSVELPEFALTPETTPGASVALSPDGRRLVYTGRGVDGTFRLYSRMLDQEQAVWLPGTEGAYGPFFSPDGQAVGFFATGKLKKISFAGGGVVTLSDAPRASGASWGDDGNIIAALGSNNFLSRISSGGGTIQTVTGVRPDRNELGHRWPQVLPGAQAVLFTSISTNVDSTVEALSLRTGERKVLVRDAGYGRYLTSGHLLYMAAGTLYVAPMDVKRLALTGPAVPMIEDAAFSLNFGYAQVDFSRSGTLIYVRGKAQNLVWLDSTGQTQRLRPTPAEYDPAIRFSPDGKRLALSLIRSDSVDVWVYEWERDAMTRLTFGFPAWWPIWSPDGKHVAFMSGETSNLYYMRADGAGAPVRLTESKNRQVPYSFSPDGKRLAFFEFNPQTNVDIWTLPLEEVESDHPMVGKPEPFLVTPFDERAPMFSPDGRWIAYESDESGRSEVYARPFPGPGGKSQISTGGGNRPVWSKKDHELFYRSTEGMMVADYTVNGDAFEVGKPRLWAAKKDLGTYFDLAPDGQRFAAIETASSERNGPEHVSFLINFFDELRQRVPAGN